MRLSPGERVFNWVNIVLMTILMIVTLYPFWYVLCASVSDPLKIAQNKGILLWPQKFTLEAYHLVFKDPSIMLGYRNTLFITFVGVAISLVLTSLGAYALSRKNLMLKGPIMILIVITMFFDGGLIPNYLLVQNLGLYNSLWALIIPGAISTFNLIIMRTYFQTIPDSLEESAKIDGANEFTILTRIYLPLSLPVIAVMVLFYGVGQWNSWFNGLIYLQDQNLFPLQLILRQILILGDTTALTPAAASVASQVYVSTTVKYATIMVAIGPIILLYPFLQKYFVKGVMIGSIKE